MILQNIIIVNIASILIYSCSGYQPGELPQIKLAKWMTFADEDDDEWRTDVDYLNPETLNVQGDVYTVSQHLLAITVVCEASYPVEWVFHQAHYAGDDLHDIELRTRRSVSDITNKKTYKYFADLGIAGEYNKATGNYTCQSTKDRSVQKSIYIFWEGSSPPYLVLSGKSITVQSKDSTSVVLPCYPSLPDVTVLLYKEKNGTYEPVSLGSFATFDAKVGFTLQLSLHNESYGKYKCTTKDEEDFVIIDVIPGIATEKALPDVISPGASFYYNENSEELVCCSNSGKPPSLHSIFCTNPSTCEMHKHKLFKMGSNGKKLINGSCTLEKMYSRDSGMARCKGDGIDTFKYFYSDFSKVSKQKLHLYFDWKNIKPENMMYILAHTDFPVYVNENLILTCEILRSYFSEGLMWAIRWKNGTIMYMKAKESEEDFRYQGFRTFDIILQKEMTAVMCLAPVWNSSVWVNSTVSLDVHPAMSPKIIGDLEESVTFTVNETEKVIECKSTAIPQPNVYWRKDEKNIPDNMVIWKANGTSVLMFHRVSHDSQGDYVCTANNYAGSAHKTIHVYVIESGSHWGAVAGVCIPILILIFVSVTGFLIWKLQLQKKVVDHLTKVVFRDVDRNQEVTEVH